MTTHTEVFVSKSGKRLHVSKATVDLAKTTKHALPNSVHDGLNGIINLTRDTRFTGVSKSITAYEPNLIDEILKEKEFFCLNPLLFTSQSPRKISTKFARYMLKQTKLGVSLEKEMRRAGLFAFLDRLRRRENVVAYTAILEALLASLCMSVTWVDEANDITPDAFKCWLSHFRTEDGMRWRDDLWGKGSAVNFQCLKELVRAFAISSGAPELEALSGQVRRRSNGSDTWKHFRAMPAGSDAEWLSFYDDWTAETRIGRDDGRWMVRTLCEWSKLHFPSSSVAEVMTNQTRPVTFSSYILMKRGGSKSTSNVVRLAEKFSSFIEGALRAWAFKRHYGRSFNKLT